MNIHHDFRADLQRRINVKAQQTRDWLATNLVKGESGSILFDENGLAFRTTIVSLTADARTVAMHEAVFPGILRHHIERMDLASPLCGMVFRNRGTTSLAMSSRRMRARDSEVYER
jgi:hypothetical protein